MIVPINEAVEPLSALLTEKKLSIFAGSGVSVPSDLPTWDGFVDKYIEICRQFNEYIPAYLKFDDVLNDASRYKHKDIIKTIGALKSKIKQAENASLSTKSFNNMLYSIFAGKKPNELHELIVGTDYNWLLTSNYDNLLEDAAQNLGYKDLVVRSYTYTEPQVLAGAVYSNHSSIIHVHGMASDISIGDFVLTHEDYYKILNNNAVRMVLNAIFMQNSILFIGYGGSDPHFEDVTMALSAELNWSDTTPGLPRYYIFMKKDKMSAIPVELKKKKRNVIITHDDYCEINDCLRKLQIMHPRHK